MWDVPHSCILEFRSSCVNLRFTFKNVFEFCSVHHPLAAALASNDRKVLLVDADPQANATSGVGIARGGVRKTLYNALISGDSIREMVLPTEIATLWVLPSDKNLAGAEIELVERTNRN